MDIVLDRLPEDWSRALAVVAHPDDLEYGASAAIARWTAMGKDIRYVLATRGEAGIDSMAPDQAGPLRTEEQVAAAAAVGVSVVEFLDHPDGLVVNGIAQPVRLQRTTGSHRRRRSSTCHRPPSRGRPVPVLAGPTAGVARPRLAQRPSHRRRPSVLSGEFVGYMRRGCRVSRRRSCAM